MYSSFASITGVKTTVYSYSKIGPFKAFDNSD